jgi:putative ATPase
VEQRYLPEGLERGAFYHPSPRGWEAWRIEATARDRAGLKPQQAAGDAGENGVPSDAAGENGAPSGA